MTVIFVNYYNDILSSCLNQLAPITADVTCHFGRSPIYVFCQKYWNMLVPPKLVMCNDIFWTISIWLLLFSDTDYLSIFILLNLQILTTLSVQTMVLSYLESFNITNTVLSWLRLYLTKRQKQLTAPSPLLLYLSEVPLGSGKTREISEIFESSATKS